MDFATLQALKAQKLASASRATNNTIKKGAVGDKAVGVGIDSVGVKNAIKAPRATRRVQGVSKTSRMTFAPGQFQKRPDGEIIKGFGNKSAEPPKREVPNYNQETNYEETNYEEQNYEEPTYEEAYEEGNYEEGGYEEGGYDEYAEEGYYEEGYEEEGYYEEGYEEEGYYEEGYDEGGYYEEGYDEEGYY